MLLFNFSQGNNSHGALGTLKLPNYITSLTSIKKHVNGISINSKINVTIMHFAFTPLPHSSLFQRSFAIRKHVHLANVYGIAKYHG